MYRKGNGSKEKGKIFERFEDKYEVLSRVYPKKKVIERDFLVRERWLVFVLIHKIGDKRNNETLIRMLSSFYCT